MISNNVALLEVYVQTSLCSPLLSIETLNSHRLIDFKRLAKALIRLRLTKLIILDFAFIIRPETLTFKVKIIP